MAHPKPYQEALQLIQTGLSKATSYTSLALMQFSSVLSHLLFGLAVKGGDKGYIDQLKRISTTQDQILNESYNQHSKRHLLRQGDTIKPPRPKR